MKYQGALGCVFGNLLLAALLVGAASAAQAQTLTDPNPHPNSSRPAAAKTTAAKHMKACPEFGAGFYRVDGTDTCFKLGGFVDVGVNSR